jgi:hypothetical protein
MNRYMGFGSDSFAGVPVLLTNPATGDLVAALAQVPGAPTYGRAYRALDGGTVTPTDTSKRSTTWAHAQGEGYALPLADIVCASGRILVFF